MIWTLEVVCVPVSDVDRRKVFYADRVIAHTNLYWSNHAAPGRTAGTVETKDVDFGHA